MAVTAYLEKYFDCVDALPHDLQKRVTELREIELQTSGLLAEVRAAREGLASATEGGRGEEMQRHLLELQCCMLRFRETGNKKLEVTSELLDTVAGYTQQLMLKFKDLEAPRGGEDHHHSPRYSYPSSHSSTKADSPLTMVIEGSHLPEKTPNKRNHTSKRPRPSEKDKEKHTPPGDEEGIHPREGMGRSRENSTSTPGGQGGLPGGKPPKKKVKIKKKSLSKDSGVFLPPTIPIPMPDLNSQPIQPDEPIYCLCQQVSFGEMIGCDNEECPIEWFHFQCVGLTSKPKGKWFCPKCAPDRKPKNTK